MKTYTYGELADLVNSCDEKDIPIYMQLEHDGTITNIPVDNYGLFRMLCKKDPQELAPFIFLEDAEGNSILDTVD